MDEPVMILLHTHELIELARILVDREAEEALRFLEKIQEKVEEVRRAHCKPPV